MDDKIFVLLIGHGGSDIDDVAEFLNLSSDINMAIGENLMILQDDNPKIYAPDDNFSFDSELSKRTVPKEYNGNKIILSSYFISAEQIIGCIDRETVIMHEAYSQLKILFLNDETEVLGAGGDWSQNEKELSELRKHYHGMAFSFTFNDFLDSKIVRKKISDYLGVNFPKEEVIAELPSESKPNLKVKKVKVKKVKPKSKVRIKKGALRRS